MSNTDHFSLGTLYMYRHVKGMPDTLCWRDETMSSLIRKMQDGECILLIDMSVSGPHGPAWLPGIGITVATADYTGWIHVGSIGPLTRKRFIKI